MTPAQLIVLDLAVATLTAAAWLGAAAAAAARRPRAAAALLATALVATLGRAGSVAALSGSGWWFVQEKVTLVLPMVGGTGLTAALVAGPRLIRAARHGGPAPGTAAVVTLFAAGYAALAGLACTVLAGYPATAGGALVTVAAAGAATLVTWRFVAPAPSALRLWAGAAALATGITGAGVAGAGPAGAADAGGGPPSDHAHGHGVPVTSLRGPTTPEPGGTVRRYTLTARTATVTLSSGRRVEAWTFDGTVPGPPLTATEGDLVEVRLRNADIARGVTLHWHGYDVPAGEDGVPGMTQEAVTPGGEFTYRFRAEQTGTYWYHTHQVSDIGVRMGLYGTLVVHPRGPAAEGLDLTLPVHAFDGTTVFGGHDRPAEHRAAPGAPVRLRLVNTDNTPRRFTLTGTAFRVVAVDGRDVSGPGELERTAVTLAAGGRYDLAFPMPARPVALLAGDNPAGGVRLRPDGSTPPSPVRNSGEDTGEDTGDWPELDLTRYGTPAAGGDAAPWTAFDRDFTLVLDRGLALVDGVPMYAQTVNGRAFPAIPAQLVRENDLVRVTVVNRGLEVHPWHLHGHTVTVLSRNGRPVTGSPLRLDTFDVRPGEVWQVAFRATNPGLWMNHCHNLTHVTQGMALHLAYEGVTTPFEGAHGG
ncbi:hypothetical protein GCM10010517_48290 [Streptosporangium fragile]|uniref:Copper-containing nitrite reductase n=1 Tax=Streptosporangium fragile TaxID=46186 RepID=A0ABN3W2M8_9ACTN